MKTPEETEITVTLQPATVAWLNDQIATGDYASLAEVIDALVVQEIEMEAMIADIDPNMSEDELAAHLVGIAQTYESDDLDETDAGVPVGKTTASPKKQNG